MKAEHIETKYRISLTEADIRSFIKHGDQSYTVDLKQPVEYIRKRYVEIALSNLVGPISNVSVRVLDTSNSTTPFKMQIEVTIVVENEQYNKTTPTFMRVLGRVTDFITQNA